jgi:hypothetical protein
VLVSPVRLSADSRPRGTYWISGRAIARTGIDLWSSGPIAVHKPTRSERATRQARQIMRDADVFFISMACTIAAGLLLLGGVGVFPRVQNWRRRRASERRRRAVARPPRLRQARRGAANAMSQVAAHASALAPWLTAVARRAATAAGRSVGSVRGKTRLSVRHASALAPWLTAVARRAATAEGRSVESVRGKTRLSVRHASALAPWLTAVARRGRPAAGRSVGSVRGKTRPSVRQRLARGQVDTADGELVPSEVVPEIRTSHLDPIRRFGVSQRASGSHVNSTSHEPAPAHDEPGSRVATDGRDAHPARSLGRSSDRLLRTKSVASDVEALKHKRNELTLPAKLEIRGRDQTDLLKAKRLEGFVQSPGAENRERGQADLLKAKQLKGLAQSPEADVGALKAKLGEPHRGHRRND